jgi:hypothetical protein
MRKLVNEAGCLLAPPHQTSLGLHSPAQPTQPNGSFMMQLLLGRPSKKLQRHERVGFVSREPLMSRL